MRYVLHRDADGLERRYAIPDDGPDSEAEWGAPAGPPNIEAPGLDRGWPIETTRRLHTQLVARGLFTMADVQKAGGPQALRSAIQAALRLDTQALLSLYHDR